MFERFTDRARRVVVLSREAARAFNHNYIGTEHLLLALIYEEKGIPARVLNELGVDSNTVERRIDEIIGRGHTKPTEHVPFTSTAKRALELSSGEALRLAHNYIGAEHILLGLINVQGVAHQILTSLEVDTATIAHRVTTYQRLAKEGEAPTPVRGGGAGRRSRSLDYLDLDLLIRCVEPGSFTVRVFNSPAGQTSEIPLQVPFSDLEIENFILKVAHRPTVRRIDTPQAAMVKDFGARLYEALFRDQVETILLRSLSEAVAGNSRLRIRLRLTDAPTLATLPWEFLYDRVRNRFLCLSERTLVVRFLDIPDPPRPVTVERALRILVVIASPSDAARLDVEQEWDHLSTALAPLVEDGMVEVRRLERGTIEELRRALRREDWNVLHFIGHGGFDPAIRDGVLAFEDQRGRSRPVSGQDLGVLLHDHDALRMVVLNACEGARTDREDPFSGVAQGLMQQGTPAVVAMQFEISDNAAISLAFEMYSAISDGYPLEAAITAARKALYTDGNQTEWGTPVLYLRAGTGAVFDVSSSP